MKKIILKKWVWAVIIVVFLLLTTGLVIARQVMSAQKATRNYNTAAEEFNTLSKEYEEVLKTTCIDNIVGMPISFGTIKTESEGFSACWNVVFGENSVTKIKKDTRKIKEFSTNIKAMLQVVSQITAPDAAWVQERVQTVEGVTGAEMVTEENNPDGLLNKEGGYKGCVYFSLQEITQDSIPGDTIVAKGTDCGGAVEIYETVEEAQARCDYLAGFDGSILYAGSYAIVGTTVIRTSYKLTDEEQFTMTEKITQALTAVE